jgi:ribosome-binding protein aMBF1 (putative translation factor)
MTLKDYLRKRGMSLSALAAKMGRPVSTIHSWANGDRRPNWNHVAEIERVTNGSVKAKDFVPRQDDKA